MATSPITSTEETSATVLARKGSHTKWSHPLLSGKVVLSGKDSSDAKSYQEKDINKALSKLKETN